MINKTLGEANRMHRWFLTGSTAAQSLPER